MFVLASLQMQFWLSALMKGLLGSFRSPAFAKHPEVSRKMALQLPAWKHSLTAVALAAPGAMRTLDGLPELGAAPLMLGVIVAVVLVKTTCCRGLSSEGWSKPITLWMYKHPRRAAKKRFRITILIVGTWVAATVLTIQRTGTEWWTSRW